MWSFWLALCDCGFCFGVCGFVVLASSVCPLMDEDNRLEQASWWEGLTVGKTRSCFGGQSHAQQIFKPIFCWWVGMCSLLVSCLAWSNPVLKSANSRTGLMVTSKRTYANTHLPGPLLPVLLSLAAGHCQTPLCRRPSNTHWQVWFSPLWGSLLLSPGFWYAQGFICALQESFPPSPLEISVIKSLWVSVSLDGQH